jgi:tripartite-type tricarboxylate transporter receptor subunit TctC
VLEALKAPEAQAQLTALMVKPLIANAATTQQFIRAEAKRWTEVIETAKIGVQ